MQAQIIDGVVHWIATDAQAALYPAGLGLTFIPIPAGVIVLEGYLCNAATSSFSAPPAPPAPTPAPMPLNQVQFVALLESAGGMTDAQVAAFAVDATPPMVSLRFRFGLASTMTMLPTDAWVIAGIAALQAAGYLTAAEAAAVTAQWPTSA
ncbi:MAG: hypothetical protein WDN69_29135 [Aliidongia sp.]